MRTSRTSWHLVALVGVAAVAGCGGGGSGGGGAPTPTPVISPTSGPTPIVTPTPAPTPTGVPSPFTIAAGVGPDALPAVAFADSTYLTTFSRPSSGQRDVYGVRLAPDGTVLDATPMLLSELAADSFLDPADASYDSASIAAGASGFGVFFNGSGTVRGAEIPGEIVGFAALPSSGPPLQPATEVDTQASFSMVQTVLAGVSGATSFASRYVALYRRATAMVGSPFVLGQIDGADVVVEGGSVDVVSNYVVAGGMVVDGVVHDVSAARIASDGTTALAAWFDVLIDVAPPEPPHVTSQLLTGALRTPAGTMPVALAELTGEPGDNAIGSDGAEYLVVWSVATVAANPPDEIRALRYLPGDGGEPGVAMPPGGFLIADGAAAKNLIGVAFADGAWLVTWLEDGTLRGARIRANGTAAAPFTIDPAPVSSAALASDGERFLVVVEKPTEAGIDLIGQFVPASD